MTDAASAQLRRFPYPFRALLSICSDLDETPDRELYLETLRFLNTDGPTRFGDGLGLEVGNTIYFDMPPDQFSYWNTDDCGRAMVRALIQSGHVDCLHSFGDLAETRSDAARALDELDRRDCHLQVWIDHAVAPSNFGADIMKGGGDVPGSPAYHADLSCSYGIEYVWRGRVTSITGQGVRRRLGGLFDAGHPLASARTLAKEASKGMLGRLGHRKYEFHGSNEVLRASTLRNGQPIVEFLRANPHWGGVSCGETAAGIGQVLTAPMLRRLVDRGGTCILYTHLGKTPDPRRPFDESGLRGLRRLASASRDGRILVTTTRRLLGYSRALREITWSASRTGESVTIDLQTSGGGRALRGDDLQGLTFYVPDASRARVTIDRVEARSLTRNPADHNGRESISLPWRSLEFPRP